MDFISVITINYNNALGLKKTIESVIAQKYDSFEYIIIDGGSNDESINVLRLYSYAVSYWISEPDKGIYDAMNKGIKIAKGKYLIFLNSGDYFYSFYSLSILIHKSNNKDFVYGDLVISDREVSYHKVYPDILSREYFSNESLPHPAMLIKRSLFFKFGFYRVKYKICADWHFYVMGILKFKCSYVHVNDFISVFNLDGISSKIDNKRIISMERKQIWVELFQKRNVFLSKFKRFTKRVYHTIWH